MEKIKSEKINLNYHLKFLRKKSSQMERRNFLRNIGVGGLGVSLTSFTTPFIGSEKNYLKDQKLVAS